MANINKIRISGTSYDIQDKNAAKTVTLTQSEYDLLPVKDPNVFYIISDSEYNFDGYWTSAQTNSAITEAVSGKADSSSVYLKSETSGATEISTALNDKLDVTAYTPTDLSNYYTTAQTDTKISQAVSGKTNQSDFSGHTANTTVHVTAQDKTNWNNKSDFSGSYNDLTDKPSIPSYTSDLTNDSNFATSGYVDTKLSISDFNTYSGTVNTAIGNKANSSDVYTKSQTSGATEIATALSGKQDTLSAGTGISISGNVISATGGGGGTVDQTIISGSTNAVAGGAVYDKFDEVEQVTARALNELSEGQEVAARALNELHDSLSGKADMSAVTAVQDSLSGYVATSAVTSAVTSGSTSVVTSGGVYQQMGGLKMVKLTQSEYSAMEQAGTLDNSTLYVIVN